jgi:hypothetical protein
VQRAAVAAPVGRDPFHLEQRHGQMIPQQSECFTSSLDKIRTISEKVECCNRPSCGHGKLLTLFPLIHRARVVRLPSHG